MFTIYMISLIACLLHWREVRSDWNSEYARYLVKDAGYQTQGMLFISFLPVVNTFAAMFLALNVYVFLYKRMKGM